MENWIITDDGSECVVHAGILGMKWGRRRYQNKDGSLTPEGRKRYGSKREDREDKSDQKYDSRQLRKNLKTMSDKELQDVINRKQKEKQLRDMLDAEISPGKKKANEILSSIGTEVAKEVGKKATLAAMDMALKKLTKGNITASEFVRAMKITDFKSSVFDDNNDSKHALTGKKSKNAESDKPKPEAKANNSDTESSSGSKKSEKKKPDDDPDDSSHQQNNAQAKTSSKRILDSETVADLKARSAEQKELERSERESMSGTNGRSKNSNGGEYNSLSKRSTEQKELERSEREKIIANQFAANTIQRVLNSKNNASRTERDDIANNLSAQNAIHRLRKNGYSVEQIAKMLGVSSSTISTYS